jgi:hypothetical protein
LFLCRISLFRAITVVLVMALGYQWWSPAAFAAGVGPAVSADGGTNVPGARVYHVTPEQFAEIEPLLKAHGYQCLTNSATTNAVAMVLAGSGVQTTNSVECLLPAPGKPLNMIGGTVGGERVSPVVSPEADEEPQAQAAASGLRASDDVDHAGNFVGELMVELIETDWTSSDAAVVIFVIIGLTVVFSVVVYAGVYLYEIVTGKGEYDYWWDFQARVETVTGGSSRGQLAGFKLDGGFEREDTRTGVRLEAGYMNLHIRTEGRERRVRTEGAYLMAGAGIQWVFGDPRNPSSVGFELLAGAADVPDVDLLSVARANLGFGLGSHGRLGLSIGSLLIGLEPEEGFVGNNNQFIPILGLETGFRF